MQLNSGPLITPSKEGEELCMYVDVDACIGLNQALNPTNNYIDRANTQSTRILSRLTLLYRPATCELRV